MRLCLAATYSRDYIVDLVKQSDYILESFIYFREWQVPLLKTAKMFLIDSGAFTFMNTRKNVCEKDIDSYLKDYIEFINKYDIKYFFELDVDSIFGYEKVKQMRKILETRTEKKCIPVFHKSRGLNDWIEMCKNYDYVAIGTITEYKGREDVLKAMLKIARKYKTKVHGLGFTVPNLKDFDFYSVDSTSWLSGSRHGTIYLFKNGRLETHKKKGHRTIYHKEVDKHNIVEWIKFQKYLDKGE